MKLELAFLAGDESKKFLVGLTTQIDRLEKLLKSAEGIGEGPMPVKEAKAKSVAPVEEDDDDFSSDEPVDDSPKVAAADEFDEITEEETGNGETVAASSGEEDDDDEDADFTAAPKKRGRPKKITLDQVNEACKSRAASVGGKQGREEVFAILKKKFKVTSITELDPKVYGDVINSMSIPQ